MQCNACVEICPVGIEQAPIINQLRRRLVEEGELDADAAVDARGDPQVRELASVRTGASAASGPRSLDFEVKDARKEPVDVLWFVGDYASFDPRSQRVSRALARILHHAGVDFGILYDGERNSGNDVRRVGEEGLFEPLAEQNVEMLSDCAFNRIVTSDPHSLNTLRNEYPSSGGQWTVTPPHQLLLELVEDGPAGARRAPRLPRHLPRPLPPRAPQRRVRRPATTCSSSLGCTLVEMPRNRDNSFCCGAGGGRIWIPDEAGQERPSENRIREAVELNDPDLFVVACPKDVTMYEDAIKTSGNAERMRLRELTELVEEAVGRDEVLVREAGTEKL